MPLDNKGEHTSNINTGKVGIALTGNFEEHSGVWQNIKDRIQGASFSQPAAIQISNAKQLATFLDVAYGFTTIGGHRSFGDTECPGSRLTQLLSPIYKNVYFFSSRGD